MLTIAVRQTIALPESPSGFSGHQWHRRRRPPTSCSCQLHKLRNVTDRLPDALASTVAKRMRRAYHQLDALVAQADLEALARELGRSYPGAAASLREGLAETLTIGRLGVPPTLARTLRSTNSIESMIEICRPRRQRQALAGRADGAALDRCGHERGPKQFRRVNGHLHLLCGPHSTRQSPPISHRPRRMPPPDYPSGRHRTSTEHGTSSVVSDRPLCRSMAMGSWLG